MAMSTWPFPTEVHGKSPGLTSKTSHRIKPHPACREFGCGFEHFLLGIEEGSYYKRANFIHTLKIRVDLESLQNGSKVYPSHLGHVSNCAKKKHELLLGTKQLGRKNQRTSCKTWSY